MESKRVFFVAHVEDVEATFDFHGLPCPLTLSVSCVILRVEKVGLSMQPLENTLGLPGVVSAHGRVSDPMAKLQFLQVVLGMMTFLELAHAGCYATVFVLSLHTCWMLRLSWGGDGAGCYVTVFVLSLHTCWMLRNCV